MLDARSARRCAATSSDGRAPSAAFGGTSPVNGGGLEAPRFRGEDSGKR